ncbi:DUF368 domain-containing protein [Sungkyunkwania multivorans]|uniref:DUF368 domain-containing protein n=1 Tax=Sungkyunkwania multivorans TaxID=1173618 RepID=A0ABW3CVW5_9FLAO
MQRSFFDYLVITLKGMAMGAADVVPGVSGGTIAFISGIYEELIDSINNINLQTVKVLKDEGLAAAWKKLNGNFLLALFIGIGISVLSLVRSIRWLLENEPVLLWAFFFGLVLASIIYVGKEITRFTPGVVALLIIGAVTAYYITTLPPLSNDTSAWWFLFIAGALAICAMILPGISGAFILVLLGAYQPIVEAVDNKDLKTIAIVGAGAIIGLLSFSKLLKWTFTNYKNLTLAALTGFIIGSLNKIWPWKETLTWRVDSHGTQVPVLQESISPWSFEGDPKLLFAALLAIAGFLTIFILERLATKKH